MLNRRSFLSGFGAVSASLALTGVADAANWGINASSEGLRAGSADNQGKRLQKILDKAAKARKPVFLEPGTYRISDVTLPSHTVLQGVPGSTVLEYAGGNHFLFSENGEHISLSGVKLDGALLPIDNYAEAALRINNARQIDIQGCHVTNSAENGIEVVGSQGTISKNRIDSAIGSAGLIVYENNGLLIDGNTVEECANGGILVHRWQRGPENTIVTNNRVRRISAIHGGTGQWGNGINTYLADGVMISGNHVSDCAFSTIRSNSCSNLQISDNTCLRAGETSIYSEFAHDGANITGNIVDGAVTGISMANFNEGGRLGTCANNVIRNIHDNVPYEDDAHIQGIGISVEADTIVVGNVIERTAAFGILMGWGPYLRNVVANANVIRATRTGMYVSVVEGIGAVSISNNIFSDLDGKAIVGYRWHDAVTGDLAAKNARKFPTLKIEGNSVG